MSRNTLFMCIICLAVVLVPFLIHKLIKRVLVSAAGSSGNEFFFWESQVRGKWAVIKTIMLVCLIVIMVVLIYLDYNGGADRRHLIYNVEYEFAGKEVDAKTSFLVSNRSLLPNSVLTAMFIQQWGNNYMDNIVYGTAELNAGYNSLDSVKIRATYDTWTSSTLKDLSSIYRECYTSNVLLTAVCKSAMACDTSEDAAYLLQTATAAPEFLEQFEKACDIDTINDYYKFGLCTMIDSLVAFMLMLVVLFNMISCFVAYKRAYKEVFSEGV